MSDYKIYSYFRSSCSARIRIVMGLKGLSFETIPINLLKDEHLSDEHRARNPSMTVPLLVCPGNFTIAQSVAALEYLEETHPDTPTLPSDAKARAVARSLVNIINADTQPVTNMRIMRLVKPLGQDPAEWNKKLMADGLRAYEASAAKSAGKYSVGDQVTMADACLMPAYWNAERYNVDLSEFPTLNKIAANLNEHPAVKAAHPFRQPDCPADLRIE